MIYRPGMAVFDPLPSLGLGQVLSVFKKTVWVKFVNHQHKTIYDLDHLQFLQEASCALTQSKETP